MARTVLSEIALALDGGRPVAALESHGVDGVVAVDTATDAVDAVEGRSRSTDL